MCKIKLFLRNEPSEIKSHLTIGENGSKITFIFLVPEYEIIQIYSVRQKPSASGRQKLGTILEKKIVI